MEKPQKPYVSPVEQCVNFLSCCAAALVLYYVLCFSQAPLTLDILLTIFFAELNRWNNDKRRRQLATLKKEHAQRLKEKTPPIAAPEDAPVPELDCIVTVVGYREDPELYRAALQSYLTASNCRFVLACIDGDAEEDREMAKVFQTVYPADAAMIHLDVPLATIASTLEQTASASSDDAIITHCCSIAREALASTSIRLHGPGAVNKLCVSQPHMHKKGVMFTAFIFAKVLAEALDIDLVWSSDSDSTVSKDNLTRTMSSFAGDPAMGGASTALSILNANVSIMTKLANAIYLSELYLARSFTGSANANDCQSGPCAAFRISALSPVLLKWYRQTVMGHWMIVNEDRHLTTCLLLEGWNVAFAADIVTATETPATLQRWIIQQVRWGRAIHIESVHRPEVYLMQSSVLFFSALKRGLNVFLIPILATTYLLTGNKVYLPFTLTDFAERMIFNAAYLVLRNPHRDTVEAWFWIPVAQLFYHTMVPAINFWSFWTVLHDGWGTNMRAGTDIKRRSNFPTKVFNYGFFVVWLTILGGALARYVSTAVLLSPGQVLAVVMTTCTVIFSGLGWRLIILD